MIFFNSFFLEHMNHGPWTFMFFNFKTVLKHIQREQKDIVYIGRSTSASPATGSSKHHQKEQAVVIQEALQL